MLVTPKKRRYRGPYKAPYKGGLAWGPGLALGPMLFGVCAKVALFPESDERRDLAGMFIVTPAVTGKALGNGKPYGKR